MNEETCMKCGRKLIRDEIALTKRLINRGATEFMCLTCLAERFKVSEERLKEKIEHFKESGCTLFFM